MPFAKFWCEQTASNVWIAELEVGFPISRFEALRAETYDDIMAKVDESYRRLTGPSEKEKRKTLEAQNPHLPEGVASFFGLAPESVEETCSITMVQTVDGLHHDVDGAGHPIPMAEPSEDIQSAIDAVMFAAEPADGANAPEAPEAAETVTDHQTAPVEPPVRQKRQYRKRGSAA